MTIVEINLYWVTPTFDREPQKCATYYNLKTFNETDKRLQSYCCLFNFNPSD